MMPDKIRRYARWLTFTVIGLTGGCASSDSRTDQNSSSALLGSSGRQPHLSKRQTADVQIALARQMESSGNPEGARPAYLAALKLDPMRADAEHRLAILDDRKGDEAGADRHFARALKIRPKDPEILCDRGYSLYLRRRWGDSEVSLRQALAEDTAHARSHANLALVLASRGDSSGALAEFAKAGCDPSDARSNLGLVLALEGRIEESQREYAVALAAKPSSNRASEGLKATTVALSGRTDPRVDVQMIAANGKAAPPIDPALMRTSASSKP